MKTPEELAADFAEFGAVVNTDTLTIEPAYQDKGTTIEGAMRVLEDIIHGIEHRAMREIQRAGDARRRMRELRR